MIIPIKGVISAGMVTGINLSRKPFWRWRWRKFSIGYQLKCIRSW